MLMLNNRFSRLCTIHVDDDCEINEIKQIREILRACL